MALEELLRVGFGVGDDAHRGGRVDEAAVREPQHVGALGVAYLVTFFISFRMMCITCQSDEVKWSNQAVKVFDQNVDRFLPTVLNIFFTKLLNVCFNMF